MFLGELLVSADLISEAQLDEGLRAKAVYGGRLGTNLVELGYVEDAQLHQILAKQHGVPAMELDVQPHADALACLSPAACDRLDVLPLHLEGGILVFATVDPSDQGLIEKVTIESGRPVRPVVASEGRLYALLHVVLGIDRPLRYAVIEAEARRAARGELKPAAVRSILRDSAFDTGEGADDDGLEEILLLDIVEDEGSLELDVDFDIDVDDEALAQLETPELNFEVPTNEIQFTADQVTQLGQLKGNRSLTFEEALVSIDTCKDREELAQIVLKYVLNHYRRALLFTVQRGLVLGWHGLGDRVDSELAQKLMIPTNIPSVFKDVCDSQKPYAGELDPSPIMGLFVKILGGETPASCYLVPFVVGKRVTSILYADGPTGDLSPASVSEFTMLAHQVRRAFARFMTRVDAAEM